MSDLNRRIRKLKKQLRKNRETIGECPELLGDPDEYDKVIAGYLKRMGLVKE